MFGDRRAQLDLDAQVAQVVGGAPAEALRVGAEHVRRRVEQQHARGGRIDVAVVVLEDAVGQQRDLPGELNAGGPGADDRERQPRRLLCGVVVLLGDLERAEDPRAHAARVVERLHPRSDLRPLVVSEVGVRGAGRDDQRVVRDLLDLVGDHPHRALLEVDVVDDAEQHAHIALLAEHRAQRRRDLPRRQHAGRDLVEQRLEQMLVVLVDQRDLDRLVLERLDGADAAEAAADDDDAVTVAEVGVVRAHRSEIDDSGAVWGRGRRTSTAH